MTEPSGQSSGLVAGFARRVLRPIISILIRNGLSANQFAAIARSLYVDVSSTEFGIRGRRTNTSRIALLTGLSRTQVKQELDRLDAGSDEDEDEGPDNVRPASRVLLGWHTDSRFVDDDGAPRPLAIDDADGFPALYESYSGKAVPATSLLKELISVGAVEQLTDGRVIARARSYIPGQTDPQALLRIGLAIGDLASTARHNLFGDPALRRRFERFATNQLVDAKHVDDFREFLERDGQALLERADNWLRDHEDQTDSENKVRIGVGVYQVMTEPVSTKKKPDIETEIRKHVGE